MPRLGKAHPLPRGLRLAAEHRRRAHPRRFFRRARQIDSRLPHGQHRGRCARHGKEIYYALCDHQEQHRRAELDSGQCLTGAHKDDLIISINGQSARAFASQGQTRTAALSLKLAEREIFHDEFDEYPVLMLDDVLSELDAQRQAFVLNRIGGGQTLITCCEDARIAERTGGRVLTVENGVIR